MTKLVAQNAQSVIDGIVREEWGRVTSALMSVCRDFDVAEDTLQDAVIADERLTLIFTCCHPALSADAQVALTLRTGTGISTPEIARVFLVTEQTMAQRLVRDELCREAIRLA